MKRLQEQDPEAIGAAVHILRAGGVVAAPTETVYGLLARWSAPVARERIYQLKHRPADKRLQMLAPSLTAAETAGLLPHPALPAIAAAFWPGALTVVAPAQNNDSIGLRIPAHPFILAVLRELGEPLAATSANLSGQTPATNADDAVRNLNGKPDLLVDGGVVTLTAGAASTVLSLLSEPPSILRAGPIDLHAIMAAIRQGER
ncbi:MAG: L-threonylcarbamoyladenylate synthase [Lentisphaeria bacterium]|jgi:L-threonylcarbamoyladenylate synthase